VVAWALAVLRNRGPYPVIVLSGEQGSAKSSFSAILRALLDPNTAPLRALPREDRDLFIAASNGHVLAFDNVSGLPAWISDMAYRLDWWLARTAKRTPNPIAAASRILFVGSGAKGIGRAAPNPFQKRPFGVERPSAELFKRRTAANAPQFV
jgi:hypothetical protein